MEAADILTQTVDKTQVPPLHQKRIVAFINHFLISSCGFLNEFSTKCETKFIELERKMQKIEAALIILEAKLDSLPAIAATAVTNTQTTTTASETITTTAPETITTAAAADSNSNEQQQEQKLEETTTKSEEIVGVRACEDVRYRKFFKMLQFGVPAQAVKLKMRSEGITPVEILDTPNLLLSDGEQYESAEV